MRASLILLSCLLTFVGFASTQVSAQSLPELPDAGGLVGKVTPPAPVQEEIRCEDSINRTACSFLGHYVCVGTGVGPGPCGTPQNAKYGYTCGVPRYPLDLLDNLRLPPGPIELGSWFWVVGVGIECTS
jgi:hypothetical protein